MLKDTFGREFHYLRLSITEACNFRCQYCLPDGYDGPANDAFMSIQEIDTLVQAFAGLGTSKVRITGGEPSLRRDFTDILSQTKRTPGIHQVAITTHGARLERFARQWQQAGLDQVNVSIDSLDPRQFSAITGQDKLQQVLKGLDAALDAGLNVKVNTVLLADFSAARLNRFLTWLKTMPVTLRFIELMETGEHADFFQAQHQSGTPLKSYLENNGWAPISRDRSAGPAIEYQHPDYEGKIGLILPYSKDFCKSCNRLRVAANGNLHLCLFSEEGIPMRSLLKEGNTTAVQAFLQEALGNKHASHFLHEGNTGATRHLAMLGG
ncbi:GTP 3',8-cyclase MoaA [Alteromonas halophila]|uniref:GTP 3',8-cyclase n=1 Tax=Alteromonas halophila TaxID=516698 RepID=A0A918JDI0_9ALTE|nr:GTP 3',8-cyclase MoaA [Alteromonas halophila]GGW75190.1 cyclic pyranopterin monophosphate synthase [Alteromonas halophila]